MQDFVILGNSGVGTTREGRMSAAPPVFHLLPGDPPSVLVIEGSRLFEVTPEFFEALQDNPDEAQQELLDLTRIPSNPPREHRVPPPTALSLNIAQACNLS